MREAVERRRADFLVGLFVLASAGVIVGALALTSGIGEGRYTLYLRSATAEDLNQTTRVVVQGLTVGRVTQVNPVFDSATGRLSFVAELRIRNTFPDGSTLELPQGTHAIITHPTPIEDPLIVMVRPPGAGLEPLDRGDTVSSERRPNVVDALGEMATALKTEIPVALEETRRLMQQTAQTLSQASALMHATRPQAQRVLERLESGLERTEQFVLEEQARLGPLHDTLSLALTETRRLLSRFDSLAATALEMTVENRGEIRAAVEGLARSAEVLEHFADQVSRRPLRLLTGVQPPPDTGKRQP